MRDRSRSKGDAPTDAAKRATLRKLAGLGLLALVDAGALSSCGRRAVSSLARERKLIILGLDGLDPKTVSRMMARGMLPHFARLAQMGGYRSLTSSIPPESPVAWATFITGRDAGGHGIYDFIARDPDTYLPYLSIARTEDAGKTLSVGQWRIPLASGKVELLRSGPAFWDLLVARGIPASVYRVPSNFPPNDTGAKQLAGLGAPDLHGTYGEFSYYTEDPAEAHRSVSGGSIQAVSVADGHIRAEIVGPDNTLREGSPPSSAAFDVYVDRSNRLAKIAVQDTGVLLREGEWSDWVRVQFEMIPHVKSVSGICRFFLKAVSPHFKLYVTPINVDPANPALPIGAPDSFAPHLAERLGPFYTQGFPHDVKALRHGIFEDADYLEQSAIAFGEERAMYEMALNEFQRGVLFYYFATSDRTQHMFWRTMDPDHPAHDAASGGKFRGVIENCYRDCDEIVGQALEAADRDTTIIVLSDHGFAPYYRSFNLNTWLHHNDYLVGSDPEWGKHGDRHADIFSNADWYSTLAYGIGFNTLYLNLQGREPYGVVSPTERLPLARQLADELRKVRDPQSGERVIQEVYLADEVFSPDRARTAPDLVIGYAPGYRCADESILGEVAEPVVADNLDKWSGDHCIDRASVPGILLANKPISAESPGLPDVTASVLAEFGVEKPEEISGTPVW